MSVESERLQTRRDEAMAFFHLNQEVRNAEERVLALFLSVTAIAGTVGAAAHTAEVVLPLPALLFLFASYRFQQYSELTVLGRGRRCLEDLVNEQLAGKALVYETAVAQIRQVKPLVNSVIWLQVMLSLIVSVTTVIATIIAFSDPSTLIRLAYLLGTTLAISSAVYSYWHMLQTPRIAAEKFAEQGLADDRLIWVSPQLFDEAATAANAGELERQTFERLIRLGLSKSA